MKNHDRETIDTFKRTHVHPPGKEERLGFMYTEQYFGQPKEYFAGKAIGDFGCGNHAESITAFAAMDAEKVIGIDLDTSQCRAKLIERGVVPSPRIELRDASLERVPLPDASLDFIWCQGVIHHVENPGAAIAEMSRCLKPGGVADVMLIGGENLMSRIVFDAFRAHYREVEEFRRLFDDNDAAVSQKIAAQLKWLSDEIADDGSHSYELVTQILANLGELIDADFIQTVRDRLEPPTYTTWAKEKWVDLFAAHGLHLKTDRSGVGADPKFRNVRKVLEPLYRNQKSSLARLVYGNGSSYRLIFEKQAA